ncbi:MAG: fibronectin type III domain-containing protein [Bacteroidales bacterium]|nr:fibronectin type III domain-containing protein [Bacteroidales bacterium]
MKLSKLSAIGLSVALLLLAGCDIDKPYERISGINSSKARPENLELDVDGMSATSISVFWDGKNAVADGALSFTVQLTDSLTAAGDNYSALAKTIMATDDAGNISEACSFSKLTKGDRYFVRIRANYAYSVYSDWVYLKRDDIVVQVSVGNGLVISEFVEPQDLTATAKTYSSILVSWSLTGPAEGYQVEYKPSASNEWIIAGDNIVDATCLIQKLEQSTSYDIRVKAFKIENGQKIFTSYSTVTGVKTPVKPDFSPAITTAEQLSRFFSEIAEQAGEADVYTLENDIDMTGYDIVSAKTFGGTFDGKKHSIKNWSNGGSPLFLENHGTIKDLTIDASCQMTVIPGTTGFIAALNEGTMEGCVNNADVTSNDDLTELTLFGAIAGRSTGLVKNCINNGNITFNTSEGKVHNNCIGGVVGQFEGTPGVVAIENCTNNGAVKITTANTPKNTYVGGVVGASVLNAKGKGVNEGNGLKNYGIVKGCTNTGAVSHVWGVNNSGSYTDVGGVAGYIEGDIESCINKGTIMIQDSDDPAQSSTRPAIGGVVGFVTRIAKDCINEGEVIAKGVWAAGTEGNAGCGGMYQPLFGGVIGGAGEYYLEYFSDGLVSGCINKGKMNIQVCQKTAGGTQSGGGGVIGYSSVDITDCHNQGELNIGLWHKVARVGAVIGWSYAKSVTKCTNSGNLTFDCNSAALGANTTNYFSYQDYVGGVIGAQLTTEASVTDCENSGTITYKGGVTQAVLNYIGGIWATYGGSKHTMSGCKNSGKLVIDTAEALCVGSLCGAFNGTMTNCETTGDVEVKNCIGISGKEPEIGSLVGYGNASFDSCTANNNVSIEASGSSFYGGICGGFGKDVVVQWQGCTVNTTLSTTGSVTTAKLLGRFRNNPSDGTIIYYKNMTFGGNIGTLGVVGLANGGSAQEGTMPD